MVVWSYNMVPHPTESEGRRCTLPFAELGHARDSGHIDRRRPLYCRGRGPCVMRFPATRRVNGPVCCHPTWCNATSRAQAGAAKSGSMDVIDHRGNGVDLTCPATKHPHWLVFWAPTLDCANAAPTQYFRRARSMWALEDLVADVALAPTKISDVR